MRIVPQEMTDAWKAEDKTGDRRPVVRATISKLRLRKWPYDTRWAGAGDVDWSQQRSRTGVFTSMLFGAEQTVREINSIKAYNWSRNVNEDVATCSITMLNAELIPIGDTSRSATEDTSNRYDLPGWFTPNRDDSYAVDRWGIESSGWDDFFMPDRVIKTYEGYGMTENLSPGLDPKMMQSGTWLVDTVTIGSDGTMTLEMRDIGRLLLDQIVFPPVIPYEEYPLSWSRIRSELVPGREAVGGKWSGRLAQLGKASSSNDLYDDYAIDPGTGQKYVNSNGGVWGHYARDAITKVTSGNALDPENPEPYWLSTGQESRGSKVWWQFDFDDTQGAVAALKINVMGGPYRVYVSVKDKQGRWRGRKEIPYTITTKDVPLAAGKRFVQSFIADRGKTLEVSFKRVFKNVKAVRLTFTHLWDTRTSEEFPWRAGLKNLQFYINKDDDADGSEIEFERGEVRKIVGNYKDYTDIVKWIGAWGGFFWPGRSDADAGGDRGQDYMRLGWVNDGTAPDSMINLKRYVRYEHADQRLPKGRVWGDFMQTGTVGEAELTVDMFDKQPLMDVIGYVRDLTGFHFGIDEQGAMIWRMPNVLKKGNYLSPTSLGAPTRARTKQFVTLDEGDTLLNYQMSMTSESSREVIFVANLVGDFGSTIRGYAPSNAGLRRTAGWTDAKFANKRETRTMADLIAMQQMFAYRRGRARTAGNPAIQIDDQIRIYEETTAETYFHYVQGIDCSLDMESGEWIYELETHWLGQSETDWVFKTESLDKRTQLYLNALGISDTDNGVKAKVKDGDDSEWQDAKYENPKAK